MRFILFSVSILILLSSGVSADEAPETDESPQVKTVDVNLKKGDDDENPLVMKIPESWKAEEPTLDAQIAQFSIPEADGDTETGELAVFSFSLGGGVKVNIERWSRQFQEEGRTTKVTRGEVEAGKYYFVELSGTYDKSNGSPTQDRTEPKEGYRLLGVVLGVQEKGVYFLQMTGPDKTVAKEGKSLRNSFGADIEKEEEVELDELK